MRLSEPLPRQIDRLLVWAGLGIGEVILSGHSFTRDGEIYQALALERTGSHLTVDVSAARARIESLPWVAKAHITRILPDKLKIEIEERRAAAVWEHKGRAMLVDRSGRVLASLEGEGRLALPRIAGEGAPATVGALLKAIEPFEEITARLEVARRVGERRWTLELAGGTRILLPAEREGEALLRLERHDARAGAAGRLTGMAGQVVDLRQDGVITLSGGAALATAAGRPGSGQ